MSVSGTDTVSCATTFRAARNISSERVFTGWRKTLNNLGICAWVACMLYFWMWWFQPAHIHTPGRYALVTFVLLWLTLIPAFFIFLFARARVPASNTELPLRARVAAVVTKAPSEPFSMVKETLRGALAQQGVVHDTWLADEDPTPETLAWCGEHGVKVSSRKGVQAYHRTTWPRRTRCKEGNLAYFYDHFGYEKYDFVAQFDADHVPESDYLRRALAPFSDPNVGYVSAPSICDANAQSSWSARGRLYMEASLHGALQAGYNSGWAPLCIGSHYVVRTAALRQIGGLGPELAEDHSTTLMFNAGGWKGVHAIDAIAHGDGPETFSDLIVQEFQWSRSLMSILIEHTPHVIKKLPPHLQFQFLFSQLWYPLFSSIMALSVAMPIYALISGKHYVNVTYIDYLAHILPLSVTLIVLAYWWRATGLFRPANARIISWEGMAFVFLRWPWALFGSFAAIWNSVTGKGVEFRVTPKKAKQGESVPLRVLAPYVFISLASSITAWAVTDPGSAAGFYIFCLMTAVVYTTLVGLIVIRHAIENSTTLLPRTAVGVATGASFLAMTLGIVGAAQANGPKGLAAINIGVTAFTLTETQYTFSGAGKRGKATIRFRPRWGGQKQ
jgi:cellulose synthase (UDP-forming)